MELYWDLFWFSHKWYIFFWTIHAQNMKCGHWTVFIRNKSLWICNNSILQDVNFKTHTAEYWFPALYLRAVDILLQIQKEGNQEKPHHVYSFMTMDIIKNSKHIRSPVSAMLKLPNDR